MFMQIFLSRSHPPADMTLGLVHVKDSSCPSGEGWIDLEQALCHIFMYGRLAHSKLLRRLSHGHTVFYDIIRNLHRPLFNIILHIKTPHIHCFYNVCGGGLKLVHFFLPLYLELFINKYRCCRIF